MKVGVELAEEIFGFFLALDLTDFGMMFPEGGLAEAPVVGGLEGEIVVERLVFLSQSGAFGEQALVAETLAEAVFFLGFSKYLRLLEIFRLIKMSLVRAF